MVSEHFLEVLELAMYGSMEDILLLEGILDNKSLTDDEINQIVYALPACNFRYLSRKYKDLYIDLSYGKLWPEVQDTVDRYWYTTKRTSRRI